MTYGACFVILLLMPAEENKQSAATILLALALGVVIGRNWPKIKKSLKPFLNSLDKQYGNLSLASLGMLARQKEKFEDLVAKRKSSKKISKKVARR